MLNSNGSPRKPDELLFVGVSLIIIAILTIIVFPHNKFAAPFAFGMWASAAVCIVVGAVIRRL